MLARMARRIALTGVALFAVLSTSASATAVEPGEEEGDGRWLRLEPGWRRLGAVDYAATVGATGAYVVVRFVLDAPTEARWEGGVLIDDATRDGVVGATRGGRSRASDLSDVTAVIAQAYPLAVDGLLLPLALDAGNVEVAWYVSVLNVQALALNGFLTYGTKKLVRRERPVHDSCLEDASHDEHCFAAPFTSFPSGHSSFAFTGAGLTCAHHQHLAPFGVAGDASACAAGLVFATTTGALRMFADRHYLSDVLAGAVIGLGAGYAVPSFVYYTSGPARPRAAARESAVRAALIPIATEDVWGLGAAGAF